MFKNVLILGILVVIFSACLKAGEWTPLFDGKTLAGWEVHSGFATYGIEDGVIVGTTAKGSSNSFLCTKREFSDFILEFEVLCDPRLNSGVQIRSQFADKELVFWFRNDTGTMTQKKLPPDRVYGYQVEISNEERANSGRIYDEARRATWLGRYDDLDSLATKAFKDNQWNQYRIECAGQSIKTFINGVMCADIQDAMTQKGIIGLQVHGVRDFIEPYHVRWRNLRIQYTD